MKNGKHVNSMENIPAAACGNCGGWTNYGGMSQYFNAIIPVEGNKGDFRNGCECHGQTNTGEDPFGSKTFY